MWRQCRAAASRAGVHWSSAACSQHVLQDFPQARVVGPRQERRGRQRQAIHSVCRLRVPPVRSAGLCASRGAALAGAAAIGLGAAGLASCEGQSAESQADSRHMFPTTLDHSCQSSAPCSSGTPYVLSQGHLLHPTDSNPMPTMLPPPIAGLSGLNTRRRHVASVIGLPLRGKAHMARRLQTYLRFFHGAEVELFNVNDYMGDSGDQRLLEALKNFFERTEDESQDAADDSQRQWKHVRSGKFAILYTSDTYGSLRSMWSGHSKWRRRWMSKTLEQELQAHTIFIEIQVDDTTNHRKAYMELLEEARGLKPGQLSDKVKSFEQHFVTIQQDGTEDDLEYMKLINYNNKVMLNNMMRSFLGSRITQFLTSVHPYPRTIYLTRHGESEYNAAKKIGGDSPLSLLGREYAERLGQFAELVICKGCKDIAFVALTPSEGLQLQKSLTKTPAAALGADPVPIFAKGSWAQFGVDSSSRCVREGMRLARMQLQDAAAFRDAPQTIEEVVQLVSKGGAVLVFVEDPPRGRLETPVCARLWTSSLLRTQETAAHIQHPAVQLEGKVWKQMSPRAYRNLDEVYAGEFEGLTYDQIKQREPTEASLRKIDKLGYRYPRGESYYDLIARLDNPIQQLETFKEPTLIIGHQAVHRLIYAFLVGIPREQATEINIPLHTVIKIDIDGTGTVKETRYMLGPTKRKNSDGQKHL
eukprot:TRINITY_DN4397_c0_g1_i1.p1 TRINITY_DN4397_c0_g1~~TRINITY_DN4397_c0_g1_i1.p1  ORF type:complete len:717 (-),score=124.33 TRINITY_DN4397_c0_g1_i1:24-2120(-)